MSTTRCVKEANAEAPRRQTTRLWLAGLLAQRELSLLERWAARAKRRRAQWEAFRSQLPRRARRALRAGLARGVAPGLLAALLLMGHGRVTSASRAPAAIIQVAGSEVAILDNGLCSLREAIVNANEDTAVHNDCPAGSGADLIRLELNRAFQLSDEYSAGTGLPPITSEITLEGNGSTISRVVVNPAFRLISVEESGSLTLQETTISRGTAGFGGGILNAGSLTLERSTVRDNTAGGRIIGGVPSGGGIFSTGLLRLTDSTILYNSATLGGGLAVSEGQLVTQRATITGNTAAEHGGGIFGHLSSLYLEDSTLSGNVAYGSGGGLFATGQTPRLNSAEVSRTLVWRNYAYGSGGGLYFAQVSANVSASRVVENEASIGEGGGIASLNSEVGVGLTSVTGNTAATWGGGLALRGGTGAITSSTLSGNRARNGGGVSTFLGSELLIGNSTLSGNIAADSGGGLYNGVGLSRTRLYLSTVTGNGATRGGGVMNYGAPDPGYSYLELHASLVAGNVASAGREIYNAVLTGRSARFHETVTADDYNLVGFGGDAGVSAVILGPSDVTPAVALDAILAASLADNGGPTLTHALPSGSPAIDVGPFDKCILIAVAPPDSRDQRGLPRFVDGDGQPSNLECDAGAFERQGPPQFTTYLSVVARP